MAGRSRGDNSRRTTQVGIWSFGIFRTVILSGSVLPLGIGGFLIAQQQSGVYLRLIVAAAVVPVATVVIRICLFPVVVLMQSNSYEPVRCAFFGLFPWRRGPGHSAECFSCHEHMGSVHHGRVRSAFGAPHAGQWSEGVGIG